MGEGAIMKIFISHSSDDIEYIKPFTELLLALGIKEEDVFCRSILRIEWYIVYSLCQKIFQLFFSALEGFRISPFHPPSVVDSLFWRSGWFCRAGFFKLINLLTNLNISIYQDNLAASKEVGQIVPPLYFILILNYFQKNSQIKQF